MRGCRHKLSASENVRRKCCRMEKSCEIRWNATNCLCRNLPTFRQKTCRIIYRWQQRKMLLLPVVSTVWIKVCYEFHSFPCFCCSKLRLCFCFRSPKSRVVLDFAALDWLCFVFGLENATNEKPMSMNQVSVTHKLSFSSCCCCCCFLLLLLQISAEGFSLSALLSSWRPLFFLLLKHIASGRRCENVYRGIRAAKVA